ncbi:CGNR zinc finger domain-containing protein [Saccharopolyspora sp. HNM0983]|uniref:CGNR zinc finger domain-containing protein n=1 Tax=Saccharopolyspora montiporae TaxID=2781240 RepID=A0A929BDK1_9PSEU|nr:CGNR zinc finger domain-containing protein [Saccharopolyspora sp. HNM0983]
MIGEPLAVDLTNTRPLCPDGVHDLLENAADAGVWLAAQPDRIGVLGRGEANRLTERDVADLHDIRDAVNAALEPVRHGRRPPASALRALNDAQRAAPAIQEARWTRGAVTAAPVRSGTPGQRLAARFAEAAAELLSDPAVTTIRECYSEPCVMLFLPTNPRRRWCSAEICGNRARVARYYQRHKQR